MPTRVPSPRSSVRVVVVVFPRGRGFSAIRESFNVQIIMMLYIVIHSVLEALHGLHEPVFSFAQSRRVVYTYSLYFRSILQYLFMIIYYYNIRVLPQLLKQHITAVNAISRCKSTSRSYLRI
jgi:hypothetical protein